jgi:hypothetical protein
MTVLGMLYVCEAIGFLRLNNDPPKKERDLTKEPLSDWELTHDRGERTEENGWLFKYGPTLVVYDLGNAIRAWLKENETFSGLSMCEVALVDPRFEKARALVKKATTFWSHVQAEPVKKMFENLIRYQGGQGCDDEANMRGPPSPQEDGELLPRELRVENFYHDAFAKRMGDAKKGLWLDNATWVDMFSLRQGRSDFHIPATIELIQDIGYVTATITGASETEPEYFQRSFCLLEGYASLASRLNSDTGSGDIHRYLLHGFDKFCPGLKDNLPCAELRMCKVDCGESAAADFDTDNPRNDVLMQRIAQFINSEDSRTRDPTETEKIRAFITDTFEDEGDDGKNYRSYGMNEGDEIYYDDCDVEDLSESAAALCDAEDLYDALPYAFRKFDRCLARGAFEGMQIGRAYFAKKKILRDY